MVDAWTLFLMFLGLMVAAALYARRVSQRPPTKGTWAVLPIDVYGSVRFRP